MEEQERQELIKILKEKEKELGNEDLTDEDLSNDLDDCLNAIGEQTFNKILNLDFQTRDNVLRILELLAKD